MNKDDPNITTCAAKTQKYHNGDLVMVAKDLGPCMQHFSRDCDAIVLYSYAEKYGGQDTSNYCLHIKGEGEVSWYEEKDLTFIRSNQHAVLAEWKELEKKENEEKSNLDWIFKNGSLVLREKFGASIESLALCIGVDNLWGSRGEGIDYYENAMTILSIAMPFLSENDKDGWLNLCRDFKESKSHENRRPE